MLQMEGIEWVVKMEEYDDRVIVGLSEYRQNENRINFIPYSLVLGNHWIFCWPTKSLSGWKRSVLPVPIGASCYAQFSSSKNGGTALQLFKFSEFLALRLGQSVKCQSGKQ